MTDPIADMLTRIRNAQLVNKREVQIPYSKVKFEIAKILKTRKFITGFDKLEQENSFPVLVVSLKKDGIKGIERVSKPGRRMYSPAHALHTQFKYGKGAVIVSTSQGMMDANNAKKSNLGGEVICQVW